MCRLITTIWEHCDHRREKHFRLYCSSLARFGVCLTGDNEIDIHRPADGSVHAQVGIPCSRGICPDCLAKILTALQEGKAMNGTGHVNGASSPEPESPKSHWSSLTGATSESETAVDEDGLPPAVPTQSDYGTPSVGHTHDSARIPIEGDGPAEPWITRPRISDTQSGAQIGDNPRFRGNSETNRTRVEDVRLDPAILGLPPIPRLFDEEISPMIQTPRAETPTTKNLGEKAPESEAPNTESIPATQTMATTTSTKETSNEQKGEMSNAETMPTMTTGLSARETSTEDETETADTETSSGQPMFWTAINRPTQIPRTEQQAREVPVSVKPTNPGVADVPQQLDGDMPSEPLDPPPCCKSSNARLYRQHPG